ncbi:MAG: rRNA maturation RNase YbeY [Anaerolineales bacterium]
MMITIQIKRNVKLPMDRSVLIHAAQLTLDSCNMSSQKGLTIVIGNDALLRRLNRQYRQVDSPTDVLSFPSGEVDPDTSIVYLGDIIISLPRALEQATTEGHPLVEELQLLVVHGTLHLLGYDHIETTDKLKMQSAQDNILSNLGLHLVNIL